MTTGLDRRKFLKNAGMGTVVLAGAPVLAGMVAAPAMAEDNGRGGTGFFFAAVDSAGGPSDMLIMQGSGSFHDHSSHITGSGFFNHFDGSAPGTPKPVKAGGLWEADRLMSFHSIGSFGVNFAGIMVAHVTLLKQIPEPEAAIPALLTVVCNIPPAGLINPGEDEGFQLVVDSLGLSFKPLTPTMGLSGFAPSLAEEH